MIELISGLPEGTLGVRISGHVTGGDYDHVLTPAVDEAIKQFDQIKLLVEVSPDFKGYNLAATWDDAKLGLRYWSGFERVAIVAESGWVKTAIRAMAFMMPCPVQLFDLNEMDEAKRWLVESLGAIHIDRQGEVVTVRLLGKLDPTVYQGVSDEIDNVMSHPEHVRLLLDLREFDGWYSLAALGNHLSLVREHYRVPERVAVVGKKAWQKMGEKIMSQFILAQTQFFDACHFDDATRWIGIDQVTED